MPAPLESAPYQGRVVKREMGRRRECHCFFLPKISLPKKIRQSCSLSTLPLQGMSRKKCRTPKTQSSVAGYRFTQVEHGKKVGGKKFGFAIADFGQKEKYYHLYQYVEFYGRDSASNINRPAVCCCGSI
jgi:hypothetical protein